MSMALWLPRHGVFANIDFHFPFSLTDVFLGEKKEKPSTLFSPSSFSRDRNQPLLPPFVEFLSSFLLFLFPTFYISSYFIHYCDISPPSEEFSINPIFKMTKNREIVMKEEEPKAPGFVFPFFPNFKFDLPFLKPNPSKPVEASGKKVERRTETAGDEGTGNDSAKPSFVKFPKTPLVVPPPLETEAEESASAKTSNPIVLWQVYALGAFLISRWVWARWNERRPKGRTPKDEDAQNRPSSDQNEGRPSVE